MSVLQLREGLPLNANGWTTAFQRICRLPHIILVLVLIAIFLVITSIKVARFNRASFVFRPRDVIDNLIAVRRHPMVLKILSVYSLFMIDNIDLYVFADNFLTSDWGRGVVGGSMVMVVISGFGFSPNGVISYDPVFFFGVLFPTLFDLFSSFVSDVDSGWVVGGVTTAVFCLAGGAMIPIGGGLMRVNIRLPYCIMIPTDVRDLIGMHMRWKAKEIRAVLA